MPKLKARNGERVNLTQTLYVGVLCMCIVECVTVQGRVVKGACLCMCVCAKVHMQGCVCRGMCAGIYTCVYRVCIPARVLRIQRCVCT